ncbi:MAG: membrane dipeptidase [Proteobacteria bacterium]|nr:membrane dipeptidase [Pseudomonadota bacterium]
MFHKYKVGLVAVGLAALGACSQPTQETPQAQQAPSPAEATASVQSVHHHALVLDAHADIEIPDKPSRYAGPDGVSRVAPEKLKAGGVDAVVMAVAVGPGPRDPKGYAEARALADEKLAAIHALVADPSNNAILARSATDVITAHEDGKTAIILGFQNARILGTHVETLDDLYASGVRVFALTHMGHNDFADSSRPVYNGETSSYEPDAEHGGLSALGRDAIARINGLGGVVDVSQLSKQATLQVLDLSVAPIIASHSNVQALSNVRRNLSDEEIDRIGATGGVIHVAAFRGYLFDSNDADLDRRIKEARQTAGLPDAYDYPYELYWEIEDPDVQQAYIGAISTLLGPGSIDVMVDHINYIVDRIGIDHVGIGNDFNHGGGIEGFDDASGAMNLTAVLLDNGYDTSDIEKIWGGNFLRVFSEAERIAQAKSN